MLAFLCGILVGIQIGACAPVHPWLEHVRALWLQSAGRSANFDGFAAQLCAAGGRGAMHILEGLLVRAMGSQSGEGTERLPWLDAIMSVWQS